MFKDFQRSASRFSPKADSCVTDEPLHILRLPAVIHRVGLSRSSIYNRIRAGGFPQAVNLGGRAVGFVDREIDDWLSDALGRRTESNNVR